MVHGHRWAKLGRPTPHRLSTLRNLVTSLFQHERIVTTHVKAKACQRVAERVLSDSKEPNRLIAASKVQQWVPDDSVRHKVMSELRTRYFYRFGGMTRVMRVRDRRGDNATMSIIELVDRPGEVRPAKVVTAEYDEARKEWMKENAHIMRERTQPDWTRPRPAGAY